MCFFSRTCHVKLVQAVVNQSSISTAFAGVLLQGAIRSQASSPSSQPAADPEALEAES